MEHNYVRFRLKIDGWMDGWDGVDGWDGWDGCVASPI